MESDPPHLPLESAPVIRSTRWTLVAGLFCFSAVAMSAWSWQAICVPTPNNGIAYLLCGTIAPILFLHVLDRIPGVFSRVLLWVALIPYALTVALWIVFIVIVR